jgi:hypothetical protein
MTEWQERLAERIEDIRERWMLADQGPLVGAILLGIVLFLGALGWYWSREPDLFPVQAATAPGQAGPLPGLTLSDTTVRVASTLLDKSGGYISNDLLPPGLFMDNMPSWELGVVLQLRDLTHALHHNFSMSRALYVEDRDLALAEQQFNYQTDAWIFPSTESQYRRGIEALSAYRDRLARNDGRSAQFYPRPDYLGLWLSDVDVSLGRLSSRLNASLPDYGLVVKGESAEVLPQQERTPWSQVDNVFYESRGSAWALIHMLKAAEIEFGPQLRQHNALLSLRAAIHELEATQQTVWSPVILNGSGFGLFANHSLIMANYLTRAQADLKDVRELLAE